MKSKATGREPEVEDDCVLAYERLLGRGEVIAETDGADGAFLAPAGQSESAWLILPKRHITSVPELYRTLGPLVAELLCRIPGFDPENDHYNTAINRGRRAGQRQPHLHLWVIIRKDGEPATTWGLNALIRMVNEAGEI